MNERNNSNQNNYQTKSKQEIIDKIINIFADNVISISDAENILHQTSKKLKTQPVVIISEDVKKIYRMRNCGKIN